MATMNPLEKKARSSFIKGLVIAGIIGIIAVIILVIQIVNSEQEENARLSSLKKVYLLNQDVESGRIITEDMLTSKSIESSMIPLDAIQNVSEYYLRDQNGNQIVSTQDENGNDFLAVSIDGNLYELILDNGATIDDVTEGITGTIEINGQITAIVVNGSPLIAKVNLSKNAVLTSGMVAEVDERTEDSTRTQEYNMIALPTDIETGDTIDIRLRMPDGTDYIVVSKKSISVLDQAGIPSLNTFSVKLTEAETLMMSNAIVENYQVPGSRLYISRYVEAGMQTAATVTYTPSQKVLTSIAENPNIVSEAKAALNAVLKATSRNNINGELSKYDQDERDSAVQSGTSSEISTQQEQRQTYLDAME